MATKTITIKKDVYKILTSIKRKDESFSELFERLVESRSGVEVLKELRGSVKFKKKAAFLGEIYKKRNEKRYDTR